MKRLSLYLDTSIWNFYFAKDAPVEMEHTIEFFNEAKKRKYDLFISALVLSEILDAPEPRKSDLLNLLNGVEVVNLEITAEVRGLANKYLSNKIISENYEDDAIHIALAVVNRIDLIVSWNFKHMVNVRVNREVNGVNLMEGYKAIEIRTPLEVKEYD
ncbi:MAG: hypothetical protein A2231_01885 [Candidatus Firestonebacteria bacterium RIFOXYA2_FULL_40_8]|nr:MAG: hypothetical protein A2231_01885 [Candidatus Firestonebacteria bacterium RIFOXYA2_FULL_40_8]